MKKQRKFTGIIIAREDGYGLTTCYYGRCDEYETPTDFLAAIFDENDFEPSIDVDRTLPNIVRCYLRIGISSLWLAEPGTYEFFTYQQPGRGRFPVWLLEAEEVRQSKLSV